MTAPINLLIDSVVKCNECGTPGVGKCSCWLKCECGWFYPSEAVAAKRAIHAECSNPVHREPPRDVECPHCLAAVGKSCRGLWRSEVWPEGTPLAYCHHRRILASKRAHRRATIALGGSHAPWRLVLADPAPDLREGRGSVLGPDTSRRTRWWEMRLECGHTVERVVRYRPLPNPDRGGTQHRSRSDVLPPPRRVRCEFCRP